MQIKQETREKSIANPVNPRNMYFKTPDPKSTKKSHKKTNSTSKKPKLKLKQCSIVHFYRLYERNQSNTKIININSKTKHEIILNIRHIFTYLTNNNKDVIIAWVPSHQGIKGNEEADIATKEATSPSSGVIRKRIPCGIITPYRKTIME